LQQIHIPGCSIIQLFQNTSDNENYYQGKGKMDLKAVSYQLRKIVAGGFEALYQ